MKKNRKERTHSGCEKSGPTAGEKSGPTDKSESALNETVKNNNSHPTVQDVKGQNKTHLRDNTTTEEANDEIHLADSSDQDELEDAKEDCRGPTVARH